MERHRAVGQASDDGWDPGPGPEPEDDGDDGPPPWMDVGPARGGAGREFRPGLEALRLAIHRPEVVGDRLEAALFADPTQQAAFLALVEADDLHEAIDAAAPQVQTLLVRLTVEEPRSEPDEVVAQLVRDSVRRELPVLTVEARTSAEAMDEATQVTNWLQQLDDPAASTEASSRLVAWLVVRAQMVGSGWDG